MSRHLKTRMINGLSGDIGNFVPNPVTVTPHARGVRYFEPANMFALVVGKINSVKEGRRYKKHIISRRTSLRRGLFQVYTYHFPKTWSAACVANRNLIKEAQRQAHALEHDHTVAALEWRIRFFSHYFNVFKGGKKPEPGMKPYSRFYQYVFVAIYRELQAAKAKTEEPTFEPISDDSFVLRLDHERFRHTRLGGMCSAKTFFCGWGTQKHEQGALRFLQSSIPPGIIASPPLGVP